MPSAAAAPADLPALVPPVEPMDPDAYLRRKMGQPVELALVNESRTMAEEVVVRLLEAAKGGHERSLKVVMERVCGKVANRHEHEFRGGKPVPVKVIRGVAMEAL